MTSLIVIDPEDFKSKSEISDSGLDTKVKCLIDTIIKTHACFRDEPPAVSKHGNAKHHGPGNGHHHKIKHHGGQTSNISPVKLIQRNLTYLERIERELSSMLNKINHSNSKHILDKITKLTSDANAELVVTLILNKSLVQSAYLDLFLKALKETVTKYKPTQNIIDHYSEDFIDRTESFLKTLESQNLSNYDEFCSSGSLRNKLIIRQKILIELIKMFQITFNVDHYVNFLICKLEHYAQLENTQMTSTILSLLEEFMDFHTTINNQEVFTSVLNKIKYKNFNLGKKNDFKIEDLLSKDKKNGVLQRNNPPPYEAPQGRGTQRKEHLQSKGLHHGNQINSRGKRTDL